MARPAKRLTKYTNEEWRGKRDDLITIHVKEDGEVKAITADGTSCNCGGGYLYMNTWNDAKNKLAEVSDRLVPMWRAELRMRGVKI